MVNQQKNMIIMTDPFFFTAPTIIIFISGIIIPILAIFIKHRLDLIKEAKKNKQEDKLSNEILISNTITNRLEILKTEYKADRIWVTQFHNGGSYYPTNKSIQKFSMFYEVVELDVESIKMLFQNIPVSLFSASNKMLLENNSIIIPDFKDTNIQTYGLKYAAGETGCKSGYIFGIRDINNRLIGTLGLDYTKRKKLLETEDIQLLEIEAAQIGGVLHNYLITK